MAKVSIAEAAVRLGISENAVRKRIRRRAIEAYKANGQWVVVIADDQATRPRPDSSRIIDQAPTTPQASTDGHHELIEQLRSEITYLRQESERKDSIIMSLSQRIPELPSHQSTSHPSQRRWWQIWRSA